MNKVFRFSFILLILFGYVLFNKAVISHYLAEVKINEAGIYLRAGILSDANRIAKEAMALNSNEPAYYREKAFIYISSTLSSELSYEEKKLLKTRALENAQMAYQIQPYNIVNIKTLIDIFYFAALSDLSNLENPTPDENFKPYALEFFKNIEKNAEHDPSIALSLAKYYLRLGESEKAIQFFSKALELKPDLKEAEDTLYLLKQ